MRTAVAIVGCLAATTLLAVSMLMNFRFGITLGQSDLDKIAYGGASIAGDVIKILAPFWIAWAWKDRRHAALALASLLFAVTAAYSITSGLGFAAKNRSTIAGERAAEIVGYADLRAERDRLLTRVKALPNTPPAETLRAQLEGFRDQPRWGSTSGCTDATVPPSIAFCARYREAEAELAVAERRAELETQVAELSSSIAAATTGAAVRGEADPQIALLLRLFPVFEGSTAELGLAVTIMALVELGATFGFFLSVAHLKPSQKLAAAEPAPPQSVSSSEDGVNQWGVERLQHAPGAILTLNAIKSDFDLWRRDNHVDPVEDIRSILEKEGLRFSHAVPPGAKRRAWLIRDVAIKPR